MGAKTRSFRSLPAARAPPGHRAHTHTTRASMATRTPPALRRLVPACSRAAAQPRHLQQHQQHSQQQQRAAAAAHWGTWAAGRRHVAAADAGVGAASPAAAPSPRLRLVLYSKEGCHLCEGLKDKLAALLDRAAFQPCSLRCARKGLRTASAGASLARHSCCAACLPACLPVGERGGQASPPNAPLPRAHAHASGASLEVHDITTRPEWQAAYAMLIPVLAVARGDGREVGVGVHM